MLESEPDRPGLALKIGIAGAIGLGAVVSGLLISRQGRRLVKEAWQGRRRTRLEDRVLDALWGDDVVGHCTLDVRETEPGTIEVSGITATRRERARALRVANRVRDVKAVEDRIQVERRSDNGRGRHLIERRQVVRRARQMRRRRGDTKAV